MTLFEQDPAAPSRVRVRATVAYDGTDFAGFAPQRDGTPTVGGTLADTIRRVHGEAVELTCAGRTDAGVHARGQIISFEADPSRLDIHSLERAVNKLLRPAISIRDLRVVDGSFDARFSAKSRRYRYTILNQETPSPFLAATSWWIDRPLDVSAMRLACDPLIGEHDFSSFCRRPAPDATLVRRVIDARWEVAAGDDGCILHFWIEANAFCHQMVRSIVGTLADVGLGRTKAGDVSGIMRALDRSAAGNVAPPHGLCLWEVRY
ncbi:MAG TPA: tRNA pseudouridine(38-40) synthase TruA [Acidimicrobiales bacterium]